MGRQVRCDRSPTGWAQSQGHGELRHRVGVELISDPGDDLAGGAGVEGALDIDLTSAGIDDDRDQRSQIPADRWG